VAFRPSAPWPTVYRLSALGYRLPPLRPLANLCHQTRKLPNEPKSAPQKLRLFCVFFGSFLTQKLPLYLPVNHLRNIHFLRDAVLESSRLAPLSTATGLATCHFLLFPSRNLRLTCCTPGPIQAQSRSIKPADSHTVREPAIRYLQSLIFSPPQSRWIKPNQTRWRPAAYSRAWRSFGLVPPLPMV